MKRPWLKIHATDNVAVALRDLPEGYEVSDGNQKVNLQMLVKQKHKFALTDCAIGANIIMYGVLVGRASQDIQKGGLLTVFNIEHAVAAVVERRARAKWTPPVKNPFTNATFLGYSRKDGTYGTANYWLFVPTVFCENRNLEKLKVAFTQQLGYEPVDVLKEQINNALSINFNLESAERSQVFENIDGIKFLMHQGGCGGTRQDSEVLTRLLCDYICHPNVAGATILALGCEHIQIDEFQKKLALFGSSAEKPVLYFNQQQGGSEDELMQDIILQTVEQLKLVNHQTREEAPISALTLGVKCGGSDGFSGITANPALGYAADLLVGAGGKVVMAEFPELNGVEQELADRCVDEKDATRFLDLMTAYGKKAELVGSGFYANPSPGNIKDGLITDAMKSAGAAKKGGTSPIVHVLDYTERATKPGLSLLCTPGNDVEATTGKAAAGCNLIVFTTGLGTPTGNPVAPVIKVSTNTALKARMPDVIDFDAGGILEKEQTIEEVGEQLLWYCLEVASGRVKTFAQRNLQDDFIPWKRGFSL